MSQINLVHEFPRDPDREARLSRRLRDSRIGARIYAFKEVSSTMDVAHQLAADGEPEGTMVCALRQVQGRGRQGRLWESPPGGAYLSIVLRPQRSLAEIPQISLIAGLACAEALSRTTGLFPSIRWPNDILMNMRKIAGILVEAKGEVVIAGVGINIATKPQELPDVATSIMACGAWCDADALVTVLCRHFQVWYERWLADGFTPIRDGLRPLMGTFGRVVRMTVGSKQIEGQALDLDQEGRLLVRLDSGIVQAFEMGEVTLLR